ncbi:predicted protein [Arabidopsis lyrata subsp. lyrata]|uniref:Predicted protein n=1 Tax=Arabidopsis lyrata subsp. lyrata TaxID=81972 RepID=D7LCR5_ARALL|nr:predicted protein [Arabidopsis lyrata subsp. lyrata]
MYNRLLLSSRSCYKGNPLHLFVIVRDFLAMVDKVCLEIMKNMQRRKIGSRYRMLRGGVP